MLKRSLAFGILALTLVAAGCHSADESDLTKEDRTKMDKLFREGIKNSPAPQTAPGGKPAGQGGVPLNAPSD